MRCTSRWIVVGVLVAVALSPVVPISCARLRASKILDRHLGDTDFLPSTFDLACYPRPPVFHPPVEGDAWPDLLAWSAAVKAYDPELTEGDLLRLRRALSRTSLSPLPNADRTWPRLNWYVPGVDYIFRLDHEPGGAMRGVDVALMMLAQTNDEERYECQGLNDWYGPVRRLRAYGLIQAALGNHAGSPLEWDEATASLERILQGRLAPDRVWQFHVVNTRREILQTLGKTWEDYRYMYSSSFLGKWGFMAGNSFSTDVIVASKLSTLDRVEAVRNRIMALSPSPERWTEMRKAVDAFRGARNWLGLDDWGTVLAAEWETQQVESLSRVAFALAKHHAAHGRYPAALDDALPRDPHSGAAFHYEVSAGVAHLWTQGFNGALRWIVRRR